LLRVKELRDVSVYVLLYVLLINRLCICSYLLSTVRVNKTTANRFITFA